VPLSSAFGDVLLQSVRGLCRHRIRGTSEHVGMSQHERRGEEYPTVTVSYLAYVVAVVTVHLSEGSLVRRVICLKSIGIGLGLVLGLGTLGLGLG